MAVAKILQIDDQLKTYAFFHATYSDITPLLLLYYLDICINVD